jgi:EAL domain-containing protein (putative c-di-GMP-specific phosphodiesterase class I)
VHAQLRGQAAWSNRVVGMIEQRARVAFRLNAIPRSTDATAVATAACAVLAAETTTARAWVVRFPADDVGVVLADSALPAGDPRLEEAVPAPFVREIRRRARSGGAWVHDDPLPGPFGDAAPDDRLTVVAPLYQSPERVAGALVVQFVPPNRGAAGLDRLNCLATVLDLSPVVAGLLRPAFDAGEHDATAVLDLRRTIGGRAFMAVTQPIVRLADGAVVGHEALTRFADGTRPDVRFRDAVRLGIGPELELATLDAALTAADHLPAGHWLSLNVSPGLLADDRLIDLLNQADGARPLVLEITEHEQVQDYQVVRTALTRLHGTPRIAVDDAGSGYASLRHILRLEPAFVKLDRTWVAGIEVDPARQAMIAGLRHFASQIGAELIGEGVERQAELDTLTQLGVAHAQGYLLGVPAPATGSGATTSVNP